jgi:chromate reductase
MMELAVTCSLVKSLALSDVALRGSVRRESFNTKVMPVAAKGARDARAEVTFIGLADFPLALFEQELDARRGMPENGKNLKQLFIDHDGLLITAPKARLSVVRRESCGYIQSRDGFAS